MKKPTKEQLLQDVLSELSWIEIAKKYDYSDSRFIRKLAVKWDLPKRRKILKPTKIQLEKMIVQEKLNAYEVAVKLGYAENGWSLIYKYCREYGIPVDNKPYEDIRRIDLSSEQKSIVYGTLLGDGSLRNTYKDSFALVLAQGEKQLEYLEWKKGKLKDFIILANATKAESKWKYNHAPVFSYNTISHPFFKELRNSFYPYGTKTVTQDWLDNVDELALAVWYLDDGSLNKRYGTITLCTNCFTFNEHILMQQWFKEKWDIDTIIEPQKSKHSPDEQYRLRINKSKAGRFLELIKPYVPDCMGYKLG